MKCRNRFRAAFTTWRSSKAEGLGPINVGCDTWSIYFYDPNGIRLELSHQGEHEPRVVQRWRQTREQALAELRTLTSDAGWLETVVAHLPDQR